MEVTNFYNYGTMNKVEAGATQINNYYGSREAEKEPVEEAADEEKTSTPQLPPAESRQARDEELCHFIHPSLDGDEEWRIHDEVRSLVKRQGIQEICLYLTQLKKSGKLLLPQSVKAAYSELVRMGMPSGEGFSEKTFQKYYKN